MADLGSTVDYLINEFEKAMDSNDVLAMTIRAHGFLNTALTKLIAEFLRSNDFEELTRLSFKLKTDLAISMHLVDEIYRPLCQKVNSIRNKLAHEHAIEFGQTDIKDLANAAPVFVREYMLREPTFHLAMRTALAILYTAITNAFMKSRYQFALSVAFNEVAKSVLDGAPRKEMAPSERIDMRVRQILENWDVSNPVTNK